MPRKMKAKYFAQVVWGNNHVSTIHFYARNNALAIKWVKALYIKDCVKVTLWPDGAKPPYSKSKIWSTEDEK